MKELRSYTDRSTLLFYYGQRNPLRETVVEGVHAEAGTVMDTFRKGGGRKKPFKFERE